MVSDVLTRFARLYSSGDLLAEAVLIKIVTFMHRQGMLKWFTAAVVYALGSVGSGYGSESNNATSSSERQTIRNTASLVADLLKVDDPVMSPLWHSVLLQSMRELRVYGLWRADLRGSEELSKLEQLIM